MITQVRYTNYKLLRDACLDLGPLNVVVGRNGIGKSTVLEGMHLLLQTATVRHRSELFAAGSLDRFCSRTDPSGFGLYAVTEQGGHYRIKASRNGFHLAFNKRPSGGGVDFPLSVGPEEDRWFDGAFRAKLGEVVKLKLHAEALAEDSPIVEKPRVEYEGHGLASVLWEVLARRDGTLEAIEADLTAIVPGAKRVRVLPKPVQVTRMVRISVDEKDTWAEQTREEPGAHLDIEFEHLGWFPADQVSEGTLIVLGLVTLFRVRPPRMVLLDDIDKALHPVAQKGLIGLLRRFLESRSDLQILATSHSPFVLDALSGQEAFVIGSAGPGQSAVRRLDTHPAWSKRKEFLRPGEFWSAIGEDWVAEEPK